VDERSCEARIVFKKGKEEPRADGGSAEKKKKPDKAIMGRDG